MMLGKEDNLPEDPLVIGFIICCDQWRIHYVVVVPCFGNVATTFQEQVVVPPQSFYCGGLLLD